MPTLQYRNSVKYRQNALKIALKWFYKAFCKVVPMPTARIIDVNSEDETEQLQTEMREQDTVDDILKAFREAPDDVDWKISVGRVTGATKQGNKEPFLFNCRPDELPIDERLRDEYGTGIYRARVYRNGIMFRSFTVAIEAPARRVEKPAQNETSAIITAIESLNRSNMERTEAILARLVPPTPTPATDPIAMMESMSTIFANMRPAQTESAGPKLAMEMFTQGVELARSMTGGGETGMLDVLKEFVRSDAVSNLLGKATGGNAGQQVQQPGMQRQQQAQIIPPNIPADVGTMSLEQINELIKQQTDYLIIKARNMSDPSLYAEWMLDNVPPMTAQILINDPTIMQQLLAINPNVGNYIPWFNKLIEEMRALWQSMGPTGDTDDASSGAAQHDSQHPGGAGGNARNPSNHGQPGPTI